MRWLPVVLLGACSFSPGSFPGTTSDASLVDTALTSDSNVDATPDMMQQPPPGAVRMIDIVDGLVVGGPHTDFPVLVSITGSWLRSKSNGGDVERDDGFDIYFSADQAGATRLAHEVESYADDTGTLLAWVKIASLANTTSFYIHYGNPAITTTQAMPAAVWTNGFELVAHMTSSSDATGKAGTISAATGAAMTGQIGSALSFNGTTNAIDYGSDAELDNVFTGGGTLEAWVRPATSGEEKFGRILSKENMTGWLFTVDDNNAESSFSFQHNGNTNAGGWAGPDNTLASNVWHQLIVVYDKDSSANDALLFVDGASVTVSEFLTPNGPIPSDAASSVYVGNRPANDRAFDGLLDEVRVVSVSRSAGWIGTQYRNQSEPSTFITVSNAL